MKKTLQLLDRALEQHPAPYWHERLKLNRNALHNARMRGHLSPAIAGPLALELGDDPKDWIALAAIEAMPIPETERQRLKRACHYS